MTSLEQRADPNDPNPVWILRHLRRLPAEYRFKISLLPSSIRFSVWPNNPSRIWLASVGLRNDTPRICTEYHNLRAAVDGEFDTEIRYLLRNGACPSRPLGDAFRDHPETLPTMLGLDPRLDNLIAARLKG